MATLAAAVYAEVCLLIRVFSAYAQQEGLVRAATIETTALTHTYTHTHRPKNKKAQNNDITSTTAMTITTAMLTKKKNNTGNSRREKPN